MQKIIRILSLLFVLAVGLAVFRKSFAGRSRFVSTPPPPALGVAPAVENSYAIAFAGRKYAAAILPIGQTEKLKLLANFTTGLSADEAVEKYNCGSLVSGGFYTPEKRPVGLFIGEYQKIGFWQENELFNGVLSVNDFGVPRVTREVPGDHLRIGLQTGPLLIENGGKLKLSLRNDEPARRVAAVVTGENRLYFLMIYNPDQVFDGPFLADLPAILAEIENALGLSFADAVNLDGGSASALNTPDLKLSELSPVGSFFCLE